jgi:hypothetical protein
MVSVCSPCSGARRRSGGCPSNCTGTAGSRYAGSPSIDVADVAVGHHLWVVEQFRHGLHRRPRRVDAGQQFLPLGEGAGGELLVEGGLALGAVLPARAASPRKRGSASQVVATDEPAEVGPVPVASKKTSWMWRPSFVR